MRRAALALSASVVALGVGAAAWIAAGGGDPAGDDAETVVVDTATSSEPLDPRHREALVLLMKADKSPPEAMAETAKEAIRLIREAERGEPTDPAELAFWRGIAACFAKDKEEADRARERLVSTSPYASRDARVIFLRAKIAITFTPDKPESAIRNLQTLRTQAPEFMREPVEIALYNALILAGDKLAKGLGPQQAVDAFKAALALVRNDPVRALETRRALARAYGFVGRWIESQEEWESLVERSKRQDAGDLFQLAAAYAAQNRWPECMEVYSEVLALVEKGAVPAEAVPALNEARLRRGNAYRLLGKRDEARKDLERYVVDVPTDSRGRYWLAYLLVDAYEDPDAAIPHYEEARRIAPYCEDSLRELIRVYSVLRPDPAKEAALRKEMEEGAEARKEALKKVTEDRPREGNPCR